jgi:hypothetical protein
VNGGAFRKCREGDEDVTMHILSSPCRACRVASGLNIGKQNWGTNSQCTHAVSDTLEGPYKFVDTAIPVWCHNPQAVRLHDGTYALFHIGDGNGGYVHHCVCE